MPHRQSTPSSRLLSGGVGAVLRDKGIAPESLREEAKLGLTRPVRCLMSDDVVVEMATSSAGKTRILRELHGRRWAASAGIPTAAVYDSAPDGAWMVSERILPSPPTGPSFLDRAVDTALLIADAAPPPPGPSPSVWRAPRRTLLVRHARGIAGGIPPLLWWAARRRAMKLPIAQVCHGDYYHRNVLWQPNAGQVRVVDWEYLGPGQRHSDLLRLWTVLPDRADRDALLVRIFDKIPPTQHRDVATLGLWLALRLLGENAKAPRRDRNAADLAHARSIQPEAVELAKAHDAWPC